MAVCRATGDRRQRSVTRPAPLVKLSTAANVATQAQWLLRHDPDYLLTYPSLVQTLIVWFAAHGTRPARLRGVRTVGETVDPALRAACAESLGVPLVDGYSSEEMGYITLQCPVSGAYHVMAESVLVEIIDDEGKPCAPGEVGQVVVTTLHDGAMPLLLHARRPRRSGRAMRVRARPADDCARAGPGAQFVDVAFRQANSAELSPAVQGLSHVAAVSVDTAEA